MNKRIKELALQASTETNKLASEDYQLWSRIFHQKFAELIVKECADAGDMAYDSRCKYIGDYIVEQLGYGVEEGAAAFRSKR